ncbi:MAG: tetratricopeptide repeat protein [Bacteroidales bacterium]|nr:tetratricopeptide repeat protein [Bacteroidales bacterium]
MLKKSKLVLLIFLLVFSFKSYAQKTSTIKRTPNELYGVALNLYQQSNFGAALIIFDQFIQSSPKIYSVTKEDAAFYAADCSVKLNETDALFRLTSFSDTYPESAWLPVINLLTGSSYFQNGRYYLALEFFNKINPEHLNKKQKGQYEYEKGFCQLKLKKVPEAMRNFQSAIQSNTIYSKPARYYHAFILYQEGKYEEALSDFLVVKDDPEYSKQVPVLILQSYYTLGNYSKVVDLGEKFLSNANYKTKPLINRLIANALFELKNFKPALPYYNNYVSTARTNISDDQYYRIAYAEFQTGMFQEAASNFQRITSASNNVLRQTAWYYLGNSYYQLKQFRFAQNAWVSAYQVKANNQLTADALFSYIQLTLKEKGDPYRNPVSLVQDFLKFEGATEQQKEKASGLLVQLYMSFNNKELAIASIDRNTKPGSILQKAYQQLTYQQAVLYFQGKNFRDALTYFEKSLRYTPDKNLRLESIYWLATTEYWLRDYGKSVQTYKTFITSRGATSTSYYNSAYYGLGYAYFNQKKYSDAIEFFNRFLQRDKNSAELTDDAELRIADSYVMLQKYGTAISIYNKVIRSARSETPYALYQKAFCYGAQGNFKAKVNTLQTLIHSYPGSVYYTNALYDIADTYSSAVNDPRKAITYFDQLVKEKPNSEYARKALVKMGLLYYKNNQDDRAITVLKKVISNFPASEEARVALSTLQSIYQDQGKLNQYFAYAKTLSFVQVSKSEEDSLTFSVGENAYLNGNCTNTIASLKNYLSQFPDGGYRLKAFHYLSECYAKNRDTTQALNYYDQIINFPQNNYTISAIIRAARIEYAIKSYTKAYNDYNKLLLLTDNLSLRLEALDGSMRAAFLSNNIDGAKEAAHNLLQTKGTTEDQLIYAHFVLAKTALIQGNLKDALTDFEITSRLSKGIVGAESMFDMAQIKYNNKEYKESEKILFSLSDRYPDQIYWVAKGFILLADVYSAEGNVFQARETLKSVLNNYPGDDLKNIAREKLSLLPKENNNAKN